MAGGGGGLREEGSPGRGAKTKMVRFGGERNDPCRFFPRWGGTGSRRGRKKQECPSSRAAPTVPIDPTWSGTPRNDQNRTTKGKGKSGGGPGKQVSRVCPPNGRHGRLVKGAVAVDGGDSRQLRSTAAAVRGVRQQRRRTAMAAGGDDGDSGRRWPGMMIYLIGVGGGAMRILSYSLL